MLQPLNDLVPFLKRLLKPQQLFVPVGTPVFQTGNFQVQSIDLLLKSLAATEVLLIVVDVFCQVVVHFLFLGQNALKLVIFLLVVGSVVVVSFIGLDFLVFSPQFLSGFFKFLAQNHLIMKVLLDFQLLQL